MYTSRQRYNEQYLFFIVPEFVIGVPRYNVTHCTQYIIEKLEKNDFVVKYTHPNMLFISWGHYVPSYKRKEIKNKYGITIDKYGREIQEKDDIEKKNNMLLTSSQSSKSKESSYKSINTYKSDGIYSKEYMNIITNKLK